MFVEPDVTDRTEPSVHVSTPREETHLLQPDPWVPLVRVCTEVQRTGVRAHINDSPRLTRHLCVHALRVEGWVFDVGPTGTLWIVEVPPDGFGLIQPSCLRRAIPNYG